MMCKKDGPIEDRYFDFSYVRVNDSDGKPFGVYDHAVDVTDRVLARRHLEESIQNLALERELRENFVMALTHDLRNPLTAAMMGVQILERKIQDTLQIKKLSDVTRHLNRIDRMVRDLLDVTKIKGNEKLPLDLSDCDLNAITRSIMEEFVVIHGDRFILKNQDDLVGRWDARALQRIIENLIGNAIKYGSVTTPITVSLMKKSGLVEISIHNEGNPIPAEEQQLLFKKFHQTYRAQNSSHRGWGIGLTLVKGLVEAHEGEIFIKSEVNEGTTFIVIIPQNSKSNQLLHS